MSLEYTFLAPKYRDRIAELEAEVERLRGALTEITEARGAFNRDPLTHAANVIDNLVSIAREALDGENKETP